VAKPTKHYDTWRIRWTDETGKRRSAAFTEKKTAELALRKAEERRRGLRAPELEPRTFLDASEYWRTHRAPQKRSQGDDLVHTPAARAEFRQAASERPRRLGDRVLPAPRPFHGDEQNPRSLRTQHELPVHESARRVTSFARSGQRSPAER
jgi:hypothetical protein